VFFLVLFVALDLLVGAKAFVPFLFEAAAAAGVRKLGEAM
jgi:hypothetical protein